MGRAITALELRVTGTNGDIRSRRRLAEMKDTFVAAAYG